jgi:NAD(P)-dependent dehydrogenase (short-subunit alcohol dehydrogenase family)
VNIRLFLALIASVSVTPLAAQSPVPQKAVLVTGASSGIGRKITERLAHDGFFVYAGARKDKDLEELSAIPNVKGVRIDVTQPAEIAAAVELITKAGRGLYGLVNNAGVAIVGQLLATEEKDFHFLMDANLYGPYRVTRAFGPLLLASKGRVVMIGSISGILARPPLGVYSMSKHAIEAYTDALADELAPSGVQVSVIEPGNYRSDITTNLIHRLPEDAPEKKLAARLGTPERTEYKEPDEVAEAAKRALSDARPQRRYMVVPNQREAELTIQKQMQQLVQLNENQPYALSREALIAMLDAAMKESKSGR